MSVTISGRAIKRLVDVMAASVGLIVLTPLLAAIAMMIKREDGGPVLYHGLRVGQYGRPFRISKFRTMVVNADQIGGPSTADDDPRITRIGARLRRYKLDELPQLLNVLHGDMSLVGPRPEIPQEVAQYTRAERVLLTVKPGITDWASIRFRDEGKILKGSPDPHEAYRRLIRPEKVRLGLEYVRNACITTDLSILAQTLSALVTTPFRDDDHNGVRS